MIAPSTFWMLATLPLLDLIHDGLDPWLTVSVDHDDKFEADITLMSGSAAADLVTVYCAAVEIDGEWDAPVTAQAAFYNIKQAFDSEVGRIEAQVASAHEPTNYTVEAFGYSVTTDAPGGVWTVACDHPYAESVLLDHPWVKNVVNDSHYGSGPTYHVYLVPRDSAATLNFTDIISQLIQELKTLCFYENALVGEPDEAFALD